MSIDCVVKMSIAILLRRGGGKRGRGKLELFFFFPGGIRSEEEILLMQSQFVFTRSERAKDREYFKHDACF